jgi:hypothetical protein
VPKIPATVVLAEQGHFVQMVLAEFAALHAGNAVRFGIRPLELDAWMRKQKKGPKKGARRSQ